MTQATLEFLGSGGSMGVPVIGCHCPVCASDKPVNHRSRPSVLISIDSKKILVDCGPDFRWQALRIHLDNLDGVILTHAHHDHTAGFDELRLFYFRNHHKPFPCLLSRETEEDLRRRFYYMFKTTGPYEAFVPKFDFSYMEGETGSVDFLSLPVSYISYEQGGMKVNGLRFGSLAYVTDIRHYDETIFKHLLGLDTLILSALRFTPSPLHMTVDEAVEFARRCGAKETFLTHLSHDLDYDQTNAYLPANVKLAYDGLKIPFSYKE